MAEYTFNVTITNTNMDPEELQQVLADAIFHCFYSNHYPTGSTAIIDLPKQIDNFKPPFFVMSDVNPDGTSVDEECSACGHAADLIFLEVSLKNVYYSVGSAMCYNCMEPFTMPPLWVKLWN